MKIILNNSSQASTTFSLPGTGQGVLTVYGTSYCTAQDVLGTVEIYFDNQKIGTMESWSNTPYQHRMMCPFIAPVTLDNDAGNNHSIEFKAGPNTVIDHNDRFTATLQFKATVD